MLPFDETARVRDVRAEYFRKSGLDADGGYGARWARFRVGSFRIPVPNPRGRRRALPFHDLHHIATGYETSWAGEAEIAAWELAGGCAGYPAAWLLNLAALPVGLLIAPRRVWRAFLHGRSCENLYRAPWDDRWLDWSVGALRDRLRTHRPAQPARPADALLFFASAAPALAALTLLVWAAGTLLARLTR